MVALQDQFLEFGVELHGPIEGFVGPFHHAQVVNHVSAGNDQHAAVAQGGEFAAEVVMPLCRLGAVKAELKHRHVGIGKQPTERCPGTMIQPPFQVQRHARGVDDLARGFCPLRRARRRVGLLLQFGREAREIVDGARFRHRRDARAVGLPMRGNAQNRLRFRQRLAQLHPFPSEVC